MLYIVVEYARYSLLIVRTESVMNTESIRSSKLNPNLKIHLPIHITRSLIVDTINIKCLFISQYQHGIN
jgi:hypothetical protein